MLLQILYFVYKNIAFGLTLFYNEIYSKFCGDDLYDDWYMVLFNVLLTSLPVISLGVLDQDVSSDVCLQVKDTYLLQFHFDVFFLIHSSNTTPSIRILLTILFQKQWLFMPKSANNSFSKSGYLCQKRKTMFTFWFAIKIFYFIFIVIKNLSPSSFSNLAYIWWNLTTELVHNIIFFMQTLKI